MKQRAIILTLFFFVFMLLCNGFLLADILVVDDFEYENLEENGWVIEQSAYDSPWYPGIVWPRIITEDGFTQTGHEAVNGTRFLQVSSAVGSSFSYDGTIISLYKMIEVPENTESLLFSYMHTSDDGYYGSGRIYIQDGETIVADTGWVEGDHWWSDPWQEISWDVSTLVGKTIKLWIGIQDEAFSVSATGLLADYFRFELVNQSPILASIGSQDVNEGGLLEFYLSAYDPDEGDILIYEMTYLENPEYPPVGIDFDAENGIFSWAPYFNQAGTYEFLFTVYDDGDPMEMDSEVVQITVGDINRPPIFDPLGTLEVEENELLAFEVNASDPDGDSITYSVANLPEGAECYSPYTEFVWTPNLLQGGQSYIVTFTATDDYEEPNLSTDYNAVIMVGNIISPCRMTSILEGLVTDLDANEGFENPCLASLRNTCKFVEMGKVENALKQMNNFIKHVTHSIEMGWISEHDGEYLIEIAEEVIDLIS